MKVNIVNSSLNRRLHGVVFQFMSKSVFVPYSRLKWSRTVSKLSPRHIRALRKSVTDL